MFSLSIKFIEDNLFNINEIFLGGESFVAAILIQFKREAHLNNGTFMLRLSRRVQRFHWLEKKIIKWQRIMVNNVGCTISFVTVNAF